MPEEMIPQNVEKEAQEFKAGKTGDEAWAEKMIAQGAGERESAEASAEERRKEDEEALKKAENPRETLSERIKAVQEAKAARAKQEMEQRGNIEARDWKLGGFAQITPEIAGTKEIVDLKFKKVPETGKLLKLVKPGYFGKVYSAEEPRGAGQEGIVYLRSWDRDETLNWLRSQGKEVPVDPDPDQFINLLGGEEAIPPLNEYLTDETVLNFGLSITEAEPEALPLAA